MLTSSYSSPQTNVATGGPAVRGLGGVLGGSLMYGLDSDGNLLPPPRAAGAWLSLHGLRPSMWRRGDAGGFWGGVGAWFAPKPQPAPAQPQPAHTAILTPEKLAHAQGLMDQMPGGDYDIFGSPRAGFYSSGALTAAGKTLEEEQVWTAPWNIGQFTNPIAAAAGRGRREQALAAAGGAPSAHLGRRCGAISSIIR